MVTITFSVGFQEANENNKTNGEIETTLFQISGKMTATKLALSKMNLVLNGQDADSVLTLGNPMSPRYLQRQTSNPMDNSPPFPGKKKTSAAIEAYTSESSVRSAVTLDSRVLALDAQIGQMENNITKNMNASLELFFLKFTQNTQPPGRALSERTMASCHESTVGGRSL